MAKVCATLQRADVRLLTLLGPPGVGKTRLSLQAAADLHAVFRAGVCFVALAPIRDPDLVPAGIAQALDVHEAGDRPLVELLQAYLRDKQLLLVLDNAEQVVAAAPVITELLEGAPCRGPGFNVAGVVVVNGRHGVHAIERRRERPRTCRWRDIAWA